MSACVPGQRVGSHRTIGPDTHLLEKGLKMLEMRMEELEVSSRLRRTFIHMYCMYCYIHQRVHAYIPTKAQVNAYSSSKTSTHIYTAMPLLLVCLSSYVGLIVHYRYSCV
ncbi:hypothetical protein I7I53_00848 [Histoplasma capsulatum var. duboisii H88]|uniref:Uncharacterized protein n=1 Tax=Ajellomyces capsulatus (strain H88) TaxID=544711 RepID=A0A8A1LLP9_AJEC8|nr:hypothetical protein I7I53_00848 [Histoplasma capsulatum var. duboisii H88]